MYCKLIAQAYRGVSFVDALRALQTLRDAHQRMRIGRPPTAWPFLARIRVRLRLAAGSAQAGARSMASFRR